jgi:hypothetical protein
VCFGCGQSIPIPSEDLQALTNQGVPSNVEASINEGLNFIPIADMLMHSSTEREIDTIVNNQPILQQQQQQTHQYSQSSSSNAPSLESMVAPILPLISSKRKLNSSCLEEDTSKKPRRALKSRQAKRSKI